MGFLFSRRWLGFLLAVLVLATLAVRLGDWQFNRLDQRRAKNAEIRTNVTAAPVPANDVLRQGKGLPDDREWRRVTATGTWDDAHTVVIRYQSRDAGPGVDVVTPLVTANGDAVAVDRGWLPVENTSSRRPRTPVPAAGEVTVTGYVRVDATGGSAKVVDLSARSISSSQLATAVSYPVYGGFVMMTSQTPRAEKALAGPQLPELDDGPHFFYGLQWWFFGLLAVLGFLYLAYDELRQRRPTAPSTRTSAPTSGPGRPGGTSGPGASDPSDGSDDLVRTD